MNIRKTNTTKKAKKKKTTKKKTKNIKRAHDHLELSQERARDGSERERGKSRKRQKY